MPLAHRTIDVDSDCRQGPACVELTRARIIVPGDVIVGTVTISDGYIAEIASGPSRGAGAVDLAEDWLLPGLIDVHTDHLEKHAMPRANVFWEPLSAALSYDAAVAAAGITTVFDSLVVGSCGDAARRALLPRMISGLDAARRHGLFAIDHRLHLRFDLLEPDLAALAEPWLDRSDVVFLTMLDDSPGRDPVRFRRLQGKRGVREDELDRLALALDQPELVARNRAWVIGEGRRRGLPVAGHDDTMAAHISEAAAAGLSICEFPISFEAAMAAKAAGLKVISGAPNIISGKSHAGNVSVGELLRERAVTVLCSDYVPTALLRAIFHIAADRALDLALPDAVAMATAAPADMFALADRGRIEVGRRADLIRIRVVDGTPVVMQTWRGPTARYPGSRTAG
jgi:alpha-D-ribose 1-methylphosphonate 5-triphosphate diphosphatase